MTELEGLFFIGIARAGVKVSARRWPRWITRRGISGLSPVSSTIHPHRARPLHRVRQALRGASCMAPV